MSFFGKLKNKLIEKLVDDEFYQPITEHQIYSVINNKRENRQTQANVKSSYSIQNKQINVFDIVSSLVDRTPELQFRLLGYDPSQQTISKKKQQLNTKLNSIDEYLLVHYENYLQKITMSLSFYDDGKQFFSTRKKSAELRFIIERMNRILSKIKVITKLNIKIKNIKNTLKILEKVPNIKQMNLMQLKSIDLQKLQKCNDEIQLAYNKNLACLINLSKYIKKVNNQSFAFIINNLKMCLDSYDQQVYEEVMKNYLIIQPQTTLQKLIGSLIEEKVRNVFDNSSNFGDIGQNLVNLIINIHKVFKWHLMNRAVRNRGKIMETQGQFDNFQPLRRLSVTSDRSDEGSVASFQLNDIVYIDVKSLKEVFNRIADGCLADMVADSFLSLDLSNRQLYPSLFIASQISQVCNNFTGLHFSRLKKILVQYFTKKQSLLYVKFCRQFIGSIQQEKGDWNRIPYSNNFRFTQLDRLLYRWTNIRKNQDYKRADSIISKLFIQQRIQYNSQQQSQSSDQQMLDLKNIKLDSAQKLEKRFEQWKPKEYLKQYEGDVILCQSSYKILSIVEKYTDFLIYLPANAFIKNFYEHLINIFEYAVYFVFNSLLNGKYKSLFFEKSTPEMAIEKIYTLKRFRCLYPQLASFVNNFKGFLDTNKSLQFFKKQIKEISISEQNHALRAKVIAVQSYKFCLAYLYEVLKTDPYSSAFKQDSSDMFQRIMNIKATLNQLQIILLTQSIQGMVSHELQTIKSLFQSIRWYQSYEDLKEYVQKIIGIIRESYQKLRSCNRGEIPISLIQKIFVFIWRTIATFSVKLFLENKNNNKRANKLNFERFIDEIYLAFQQNQNKFLSGLSIAYNIFKSIFKILFSPTWQQCKQYLVETLKKYDYIYPILINILQASQYMGSLSQRQKQLRRQQFRQEIQSIFKQK